MQAHLNRINHFIKQHENALDSVLHMISEAGETNDEVQSDVDKTLDLLGELYSLRAMFT